MQKKYLDRLPLDIRGLVEEIERACGVEVVVKVVPDRARNLAVPLEVASLEYLNTHDGTRAEVPLV